MLVPPLLVTHAPATGPSRSAALVASVSSEMYSFPSRGGRRRATSLIADQITAAANRTKPVDSQPAAVCETLPHDRVALLLCGAASAHSANADRANLRAASLPNLVRDNSDLAGLLSEGS
jgi:hypothetical protein